MLAFERQIKSSQYYQASKFVRDRVADVLDMHPNFKIEEAYTLPDCVSQINVSLNAEIKNKPESDKHEEAFDIIIAPTRFRSLYLAQRKGEVSVEELMLKTKH